MGGGGGGGAVLALASGVSCLFVFSCPSHSFVTRLLSRAVSRLSREWNEDAARAKLLSLFEAVGLEDAWVAAQRRRLSLILFG